MRIKNLQLRVNGERGIGEREQVGRRWYSGRAGKKRQLPAADRELRRGEGAAGKGGKRSLKGGKMTGVSHGIQVIVDGTLKL